jgi:hypothetical protein
VYDDASAGAISCDHDLRSSALILPTDNRILLPGEDILFQYLNMNSKQAKELSLPQFLHQLGYAPAHRRGQDIWYTSPFRPNEQTPSFKIDHAKNFWFDFGMGRGGTIIEFVQLLYATEDVARVLAIIAEVNGGATRVRQPAIPEVDRRAVVQKEKPIIESVKNISDHALESYLLARAIPLDLARLYLREIAYRIGGR